MLWPGFGRNACSCFNRDIWIFKQNPTRVFCLVIKLRVNTSEKLQMAFFFSFFFAVEISKCYACDRWMKHSFVGGKFRQASIFNVSRTPKQLNMVLHSVWYVQPRSWAKTNSLCQNFVNHCMYIHFMVRFETSATCCVLFFSHSMIFYFFLNRFLCSSEMPFTIEVKYFSHGWLRSPEWREKKIFLPHLCRAPWV